ncbi:Nitrate transporter [Rhizoctonia solani]|uniref:Nitrate transporter n=1 Tax=Rhizoctonia solani TaxID=456999 RepID=A0A8H7I2J7_9AGAM|nr:Nitrate transporter [Rhizoctonia solani]
MDFFLRKVPESPAHLVVPIDTLTRFFRISLVLHSPATYVFRSPRSHYAFRDTLSDGPPPFRWSSLWKAPVVNPLNLKSYTIPIFNLSNRYSVSFHLSWLGFLVAFLSWFAFPPLIPEAIKSDLKLTNAQVVVGPLVDRYGPRKVVPTSIRFLRSLTIDQVMASLLVLGAIPSGLAGTATKASHLYAIRFFIGILGGTFVPCQAWTTAFFDKNVVGTANALVGGWGNMGGGITFIIMVSLFQQLIHSGLSDHIAWRVAFVAVPYRDIGPVMVQEKEVDEKDFDKEKSQGVSVQVKEVSDAPNNIQSELDVAVNEPLTLKTAMAILAVDANLVNVLYGLYQSPTFGQLEQDTYVYSFLHLSAETHSVGMIHQITAIYGLLNMWTRPLGGLIGDAVYRRWGVPGKKCRNYYWDLVVMAIFNEAGCGANFALVPHCNPYSNGLMSGIVGSMGNLGGIIFALVFRFQPAPLGKAFWICGVIVMTLNASLVWIRVPAK